MQALPESSLPLKVLTVVYNIYISDSSDLDNSYFRSYYFSKTISLIQRRWSKLTGGIVLGSSSRDSTCSSIINNDNNSISNSSITCSNINNSNIITLRLLAIGTSCIGVTGHSSTMQPLPFLRLKLIAR